MGDELDEKFMREAIELSKEGDWPYGSVIVDGNGKVLARAFNTGVKDRDCTRHAEMNAIRIAQHALPDDTADLEGCTLYSSSEPCPMCATAIVWSRVSRVVFGATIKRLISEAGQMQISISFEEVVKAAKPWTTCSEFRQGVLEDEALEVVKEKASPRLEEAK
ncbi:tRNA-specific adenosine deaminase [Hondaea fermentalgiana]|uniref:tRNA-specific adenosine deaminase n=1 Tax=Hondaea fermentalgiana TaxID=2315210 RepID=A0A2R5G010_9STRA|nr:tRNA-specific adenosine deaminase [Hondaea fermentalgiana]|eukprot:GBG23855.1 tRNA-specific adenosine deaminase [Hondaea fermentalgiana]